jgi:hypothetical protein
MGGDENHFGYIIIKGYNLYDLLGKTNNFSLIGSDLIRQVRKLSLLLVLTAILSAVLACSRPGIFPTSTPLPLPTELATMPLPSQAQLGELEAAFVSVVSSDGAGDERCYNLYRFYPDGLALYTSNVCFSATPVEETWSETSRWFQRENRQIPSGDYYLDNNRLWIRIVSYDSIHETINLRLFQGEYCNNRMVLQEPSVRSYAGAPSELTEPVLEYVQMRTSEVERTSSPTCHVAGFRVLFRPSVVVAGGGARYQIQTDPGEACVLDYTDPRGTLSRARGTGVITADANGVCSWIWEVGSEQGYGTVRVSIDEIVQEYAIEIR